MEVKTAIIESNKEESPVIASDAYIGGTDKEEEEVVDSDPFNFSTLFSSIGNRTSSLLHSMLIYSQEWSR